MDDYTEEDYAFKLAKQCVFKMYRHGNAQKWDELEVWGKCLTNTAAKFPKNADIQLVVVQGAFSAMFHYDTAQAWDALEVWGMRLIDAAAKFPQNEDIQLVVVKGAVKAISRYGAAQAWDALETWGKLLTDIAKKFPQNGEIQLALAKGAFFAISDYGAAQAWNVLKTWGKRLANTAKNFPKNGEIHLALAHGAFSAMYDYGRAQKWDALEVWGKRLADTADKFPQNKNIQRCLAGGALNAIASYVGKKDGDVSYNKWRDILFEGVKRNPDNTQIKRLLQGGELETLLGCKSWKEVPEPFLELWVIQNEIVDSLKVETDSDLKTAYYTSHDIFHNHIIGENTKDAKMRLYSVASANDPMEGKVLGKFLGSQGTARYDEKMVAAQTSFSSMVDCLNQFRLYSGQGQEGKGICLVFNKNYFSEAKDPASYLENSGKSNLEKSQKTDSNKLHLYWVLYYDYRRTDHPKFIHTPAYQETALRIDASESDASSADAKSDAERKKWEERNRKIGQMMQKLRKIYTDICANGKEKDKENAWQVLIYLRHLVKDVAFAEEREMRMLKLFGFNEEKLNIDPNNERLYVEYRPIFGEEHVLDEVIVGPLRDDFKQKTQLWKHIIATTAKDIPMPKFTQSQAPLAPPAQTSCPTPPHSRKYPND